MYSHKKVLLLYPYPWFSVRLNHKDVIQFPKALSRCLNVSFESILAPIVTGEELENQHLYKLRLATIANVFILSGKIIYRRILYDFFPKICFVIFHLSWSTAILVILIRLISGNKPTLIVKTDISSQSNIAKGRGSIVEKISIKIINRYVDIIIGETKEAVDSLKDLFSNSYKVLHCRNGIDSSSIPSYVDNQRLIDVLILSRFNIDKKGSEYYKVVVPHLLKCGYTITLVGGAANEVFGKYLVEYDNLTIFNQLPHEKVMQLMGSAKIFLNLSIQESFLIALLEARAMGCKVLTTPVGVAPEIAKDDSRIMLINPDEKHIENLINNHIECGSNSLPNNLGGWDDVILSSKLIPRIRSK